jgi:hypothetical protein
VRGEGAMEEEQEGTGGIAFGEQGGKPRDLSFK